jgi:NRAMP (natural resistance-associated macrophage protein)-like metal ion transporter
MAEKLQLRDAPNSEALLSEPAVPLPPVGKPEPLPTRFSTLRRRFPSRSTIGLYAAAMGPGLISALAGNDAGGIGTYSFAGAQYGYRMMFVMLTLIFIISLVQEMAARMGAVTQKGLGELIREQYGVSWTLFALGVMFVANTATVVAEFAGIGSAGELFGISKYISIPLSVFFLWLVVTRGPFRLVERVFLAICLVQLTYVVAAIVAVNRLPESQRWMYILHQTVIPQLEMKPDFVQLAIAVVGTTVAPWMTFFLQSNMVDKGVRLDEYRYQKADVYLGSTVTVVIAMFIIVCTAATLYPSVAAGALKVQDTEQIAQALAIPLGHLGLILFAAGLLFASLLAAAVLPLATAYTYCESFGWEIGLERTVKQAPMFYGFFSATIFIGAVVAMIPSVSPLAIMLLSQVLNGMLLPVVLIFMLRLVNDRRIMGDYVNSSGGNIVTWGVVSILILLTLMLLKNSVFPGSA